jgi:hypothetical protein
MIEGLTVIRMKGRLEVICPAHPDAMLDRGYVSDEKGSSRILWQCPRCKNSANWKDGVEMVHQISRLAERLKL